jgi:hypothetical protein
MARERGVPVLVVCGSSAIHRLPHGVIGIRQGPDAFTGLKGWGISHRI